MDGDYLSGPSIFPLFYDPTRQCPNCTIGGLGNYNKDKKQLFAVSAENYVKYKSSDFKVLDTLYYPDSTKADFYYLEVVNPEFKVIDNKL
jgi:hypothetical protein